jgi:sugar lactone lactonase YvrE
LSKTFPPTVLEAPRCIWPAGATLGEGTLWSVREQALYWVDILERRLHRFDPAGGERRSWDFDEEISAVAERMQAPGLLVTLRRGFAFFDPAASELPPTYLHQPEQELPGNRFNDGKCDAEGRFWGGTMDFACEAPTGALYRFDPDGRCSRHDQGFAVTNGPTWSLDGRTMYFNDTVTGRIHAYDIDMAAGTLANKRQWLRFARGDGLPDGMTTDAAGRLWIAHWGGACVSCHDPVSAEELCRVKLPTSHITNCAFGDADLCTLYITSATSGLTPAQREAEPEAGGLFAVRIDSPGLPAPLFGG